MPETCAESPGAAIFRGVVVRKLSFVRIVMSGDVARIVTPPARYAARRSGDAYEGEWIATDAPLPDGMTDAFTESEARLLLPFLRAKANVGRDSREPTTADGRLIVRAKKSLGMSAGQLAKAIGAHESALSRAMGGELPVAHRESIRTLLREREAQRSRTR
jgi:hypothetical protein